MPDQGSKTEQPTQRRIEKARREGQFASAREFVSALQFLAFLGLIRMAAGTSLTGFRRLMRELVDLAFAPQLSCADVVRTARLLLWSCLAPLIAGGLAVALITVAVRLATTKFGWSLSKLVPDFGRLNPAARLRDLPRQNLASVVEAALLIPLFLWAVWVVVRDRLDQFLVLPLADVRGAVQLMSGTMMSLLWKASGLFLVFGAVDLFRQLRRYRQELRMSRQDLKEEIKDIEGNPQMKARIRRLQRDRARRQMMKEVPKATAVVVNPTHFAVAIRYDLERMAAPLVVAKGKNYMAQRIRQKAIENQVPIVENPPLAQALYGSVEVGQEIPPHLYRAVAEILAYIFKLMNGKPPR
ncbi:MAG: EscU/YscU/HrcU family type III secretion system export apparatus switch protein [Bryobacteraceae bacterium]|jgi:flagellar biosynthesis protein FlhB